MTKASGIARFFHKLTRKKTMNESDGSTKLHKCLNVFELTMMGLGGMVGSGIYILIGTAAKDQAGPGIIVSFLLAAVVISLAAMCYTELAARVPKTGSIYLFMYISLGECTAFLAGWTALVGLISAGATNGRAWSAYLDSLCYQAISNFTESSVARWTVGTPIAPYPDFVAAAVILVMTVVVACGASCSAKFNAAFAGLNVCILTFCCVAGFLYGDKHNWTDPETHGFFPYGWTGVIKGAGACFFAFTGFEIIATAVEESKKPKRDIPVATGCSICLVALLYTCTAAALTYVISYQNLDIHAPLPSAFRQNHIQWAYYIVSLGPLCGLTTTLFSALYGFVRITYAMAQDGLLFPFCHSVNKRTLVPVYTTLIGGFLMAVVACFFDISVIINVSIIISLLQFSLVDLSVIILRYRPMNENAHIPVKLPSDEDLSAGTQSITVYQWKINKFRESAVMTNGPSESMNNLLEDSREQQSDDVLNSSINSDALDNLESVSQASIDLDEVHQRIDDGGSLKPAFSCLKPCLKHFPGVPGQCVLLCVVLMAVTLALLSVLVVYGDEHLEQASWWSLLVLFILSAVVTVFLFLINAHKQSLAKPTLKVPCLPWLPALSLFLCTLLLISAATPHDWAVFSVILLIGTVVYLSYGIHHSALNPARENSLSHTATEVAMGLLDNISDDDL